MELKLSYDPCTLSPEIFERKGERLKKLPWLSPLSKMPMDKWFEATDNWRGFIQEVTQAANEDVSIVFEGREVDYEDFVALCGRHGDQGKFSVTVQPPDEFLHLEEGWIKRMKGIRKELKAFQSERVDEATLAKLGEAQEQLKKCWDDEFQIAIVAPMSSGKSTVINALLRQQIMPTGNEATTAKVFRIKDVDGADGISCVCRDKGEKKIGKRISFVTKEILSELNGRDDITYIDLEGDLPGIFGKDLKLVLLDTPGPNNAAVQEHRETTNRVIHDEMDQPLILFVMDATNPRNDAEAALLEDISNVMRKSQQAQERFIFVYNKADLVDPDEDGRTLVDILKTQREYLAEKFQILAPKIICLSAEASLLQSLAGGGTLNEKRQKRLDSHKAALKDLDCAGLSNLSPGCRAKLDAELERAQKKGDESAQTQIISGVYGLELTINEYLGKYARPYKIRRCVENVSAILKDVQMHLDFEKAIHQDKAELKKAKKVLAEIRGKKDQLKKRSDALKELKLDGAQATEEIMGKQGEEMQRAMQTAIEDKLHGQTEISVENVKKVREALDQELRSSLERMKKALNEELDQCVQRDFSPLYQKCRKIIDTYQVEFAELSGVTGEDICGLTQVKEFLAEQENYSLDAYLNDKPLEEHEKYHIEKTIKKNPKREGILGFFKFREPWKISVDEKVPDGNFINADEFVAEVNSYVLSVTEDCKKKVVAGMVDLYEGKKTVLHDFLTWMDEVFREIEEEFTQQLERVEQGKSDIEALKIQRDKLNGWIKELEE